MDVSSHFSRNWLIRMQLYIITKVFGQIHETDLECLECSKTF